MIRENLAELAQIELVEQNHERIKALLMGISRLLAMAYRIPAGEKILRGRLISDCDKKLIKRTDFSYKPQQYNETYQRASTPHKTMFYGSIFPKSMDGLNAYESPFPRIVVLHELVHELGNQEGRDIRQPFNMGVWRTKKPLLLYSVCQHEHYEAPSSMIQIMKQTFQENLAKYDQEKRDDVNAAVSFLANEFAKTDTSPHTQYMISAIFSELISEFGYDGVLYPSARMKGAGINICITPSAVNKRLEFIGAGEGCLYKRGKYSFVNSTTQAWHVKGQSLKYKVFTKVEGNLPEDECWAMANSEPIYAVKPVN